METQQELMEMLERAPGDDLNLMGVSNRHSRENTANIRAKCPVCGSIRIVTNPKQSVAICPNYDCKTKSDRPRVFWILKKKIIGDRIIERRLNTIN